MISLSPDSCEPECPSPWLPPLQKTLGLRQLVIPAWPVSTLSWEWNLAWKRGAVCGGTAWQCQMGAPAVQHRWVGKRRPLPLPGKLRPAGAAGPGWRRIRLLHFLCNSSSGLPPASIAGKSMCSDSIISQVASLHVHCAGKVTPGHVCMDPIYL